MKNETGVGNNTQFKFKVGDKFPMEGHVYEVLKKSNQFAFCSVKVKPTGYAVVKFHKEKDGSEGKSPHGQAILTKETGTYPLTKSKPLTLQEATEYWQEFLTQKEAASLQASELIEGLKNDCVGAIVSQNMQAEGKKQILELHEKLSELVNAKPSWQAVMNDTKIDQVFRDLDKAYLLQKKVKVRNAMAGIQLQKLGFTDFGKLKKEAAAKLSKKV